MQPARWFAVGSAEGTEQCSGARAADEALAHDDPKLLVVFCSQSHDLPAPLREIRTRSGNVPLIGCTTAGEIAAAGLVAGAAGPAAAFWLMGLVLAASGVVVHRSSAAARRTGRGLPGRMRCGTRGD